MLFTNVEINEQLFDFVINENHPLVRNALSFMTEEQLRETLVRAMHNGGLTYDNLEEMNEGGTWCVASKAASVS